MGDTRPFGSALTLRSGLHVLAMVCHLAGFGFMLHVMSPAPTGGAHRGPMVEAALR
jgi:hypothetical protein